MTNTWSEKEYTKPNVLILIATDIVGGPGKGIFQFIKYSKGLNFDYMLCNYNPTFKKKFRNDFMDKAKELGISVCTLKQKFKIDPLLVRRGYKLARRSHCNLIQTHGYKSNILGFLLKSIHGFKWIGFSHGYTSDNAKIEVYNCLESFALRFADKVVAVSGSMKDILIKNGVANSKIEVIKNAVENDSLIPTIKLEQMKQNIGLNDTHIVIGVVGRLNPEKGQIIFLHAMRQMLSANKNLRAIIIGDGQDKDDLINYCKRTGIESYVKFLGHQTKIANYYQIMDLLVIPSLSEGLPNVLLEAMAFGIPVAATSVGGIPEVLNDQNGMLIPPGNPKIMGREVSLLINDKERMRFFVANAHKTILSQFQPEIRAQKIVRIYHDILCT